MAKINPKNYTYILSLLFAVGGLCYINLVDENDEKIYKQALESGKKELFIGRLKSIELVNLRDKMVFVKEDSTLKTFIVSEINTTQGLKPNDIKEGNWYEVVKILNADKIIDMHPAVEGEFIDEVKNLSGTDKDLIKEYIEEEFMMDLILSAVLILIIMFSSFMIYKNKLYIEAS